MNTINPVTEVDPPTSLPLFPIALYIERDDRNGDRFHVAFPCSGKVKSATADSAKGPVTEFLDGALDVECVSTVFVWDTAATVRLLNDHGARGRAWSRRMIDVRACLVLGENPAEGHSLPEDMAPVEIAEWMLREFRELADDELLNIARDAQVGLCAMEHTGMLVDVATLKRELVECEARQDKAAAQARGFLRSLAGALDDDGVLHPLVDMWPAGTVTGRMSCKNPNMLAVPGDMRHLFVARDGHTYVSVDMKAADLWSIGRTLCPDMEDDLMSGTDIYLRIAEEMYATTYFDLEAEHKAGDTSRRDTAKTTLLGVIYGQGAKGLAKSLDVDVKQAQRLIDKVHSAYPEIEEGKRAAMKAGKAACGPGYALTEDEVPVPVPHDYMAVSRIAQTASSGVFRRLIAALVPEYGGALRLPIHDEVLLELPTTDPEQIQAHVERIRTVIGDTLGGIQAPVDIEVHGAAWRDKTA